MNGFLMPFLPPGRAGGPGLLGSIMNHGIGGHDDWRERAGYAILVMIALVVIGGGAGYHSKQEGDYRRTVEAELEMIGQSKVEQISQWRSERLADGWVMTGNLMLVEAVARRALGEERFQSDLVERQLRTWWEGHGYDDVFLLEENDGRRASATGRAVRLEGALDRVLTMARRERRPILSDVHVPPGEASGHVDVVAPLILEYGEVAGMVVLRQDTGRFLHRLLDNWPTPSRSAEIMLLRHDGDGMICLNNLRHRSDAALRLRVPAASVGEGETTGAVTMGQDYRGVRTMSVMRRVPHSDWLVMAKIDEDEAFADWRRREVGIMVSIGGMLLAIALAAHVLRRQRARYRELERTAIALHKANRAHRLLGEAGEALTKVEEEMGIARVVCRVLAEQGGYRMAWMGLVEDGGGGPRARPIAQIGFDDAWLERAGAALAASGAGDGVLARVLRAGRTEVVPLVSDQWTEPCWDRAGSEGCRAAAVLPLIGQEGVVGVLVACAGTMKALDSAEIRLLEDLAADVALGVEAVRLRAEGVKQDRALRESEDRFRMLVEGVRDYALIKLDAEGCVVSWNSGAERVTGYPAHEILGQHIARCYAVDGAGVCEADSELAAAAETGHLEYEGWRMRRDGGRYMASVVMTALRDETGWLHGFAVVTRDITERWRAEEEIRELNAALEQRVRARTTELVDSEHRFRAIFEQAAVGISHVGLDGHFLSVNQKLCEMVGYPCEELLRLRFQDITYEEDLAPDLAHVERLLRGEIPNYQMEKRYWRRDGTLVWVNLTVALARKPTGQPDYFISVVENIEDRKRMEQALRESEDRLRQLAESMPDAVMVEQDGRCVYANPSAAHLLGAGSAGELLKLETLAVVDPDRHENFLRQRLRLMGGEQPPPFEDRFVRRDGTRVAVEISGSRMSWRDRPAFQIVARDITERQQAQQAIQLLNGELRARANELETANQELEAFSYSVSHDLRAPLRTIDGFARAVIEDFGPGLPAECRRQLNIIWSGSQRMMQLIDDLLAFSRLGRKMPRMQLVNMTELVRGCVADLTAGQTDRRIDLRVAALPEKLGDPSMLKQAWLNLLSNALKFTRNRNPAVIEIGTRREDEEDVFFVRDNGTGFDMEYAHKLFVVFQRLHRVEDFEGTGVGLAIVHRVVQRHGGRIWAEAEVDRGATFHFTLGGKET